MPDFRRYYIPNALVFITANTVDRIPYFEQAANINLLLATMREVQKLHPFHLLAYVILPDHLHWLMRAERTDHNFSKVMQSIKRNFTLNFKRHHSLSQTVHLWQERFWDHIICDQQDLNNHMDYIHWNPVKHGYVTKPEDWAHSTYRFWVERNAYALGWGYATPCAFDGVYGE